MRLDQQLAELMRRSQDGDRHAYEAFLVEVMALVKAFARKRLPRADQVEDVAQETLLAIHRDRHSYDPERPFLPACMRSPDIGSATSSRSSNACAAPRSRKTTQW
ncbi:MAG: hypothetical protein E6J63_09305 [Deltaproteobacteria bacterium]|nr:MAG: hypothetical protein E6J63_09305 [Deltaproteobacteria bacterium]